MKKRVRIPKQNAKALLDLVTKLQAKHFADGDASPLKVLNWDTINRLIAHALEADEKAIQYKRETLSVYQQRAQALEKLAVIARNSRDILTGVHRDKMKLLGLWGFDVLNAKVTQPEANDEPPIAAAA